MAHAITLIPGDGIGPEVTDATLHVLEATGVKFDWDVQRAGAGVVEARGTTLPGEVPSARASSPSTSPSVKRSTSSPTFGP
jgi:isocitrate/isopropylmalate dehydrogenase